MIFPNHIATPKRKKPQASMVFNGFPRGLNTAIPSEMISKDELAECVDYKYNQRGELETRAGIVRYSNMGCTKDNLFGDKYRTFSTWDVVTAGVVKDQIGIDEEVNAASTLSDTSAVASQYVAENFTILDDSLPHSFYFALKIDVITNRYPLVRVDYSGGITTLSERIIINTTDGSVVERSSDGEYEITIFDGWIYGHIFMENNNTGNTLAQCFLFPAGSSDGSVVSVAAQGSAVFDWCLFCDGQSADVEVKTIGYAVIDGEHRTLVCDENNVIYYLKNTTHTKIGTAAGESQFISYNDVCLVLDGSYIKYLDDVSSLKIAYDISENFFDNESGDDDGGVALSVSGVGCLFTTPDWDAGFTIPPVTITAKVKETTPGSGTIEVSFYDVVGTTEIAALTYSGNIPDTADFVDFTFTSSDITSELEPNKQYRCLFKGTNVDLQYTTVASGGTLITGGSSLDATKDPIIKITPGLPPKASFGAISDKRPFLYGDPDNPGYAWYGKLSYLEYNFLSSVDESNNSYEIGGLEDLYGDLWVFGTEEEPYLARLVGDIELEWRIVLQFQKAWTLPKTLINIGNDLISGSLDGIDFLSGVQEYGDVRSSSASDNIEDKIENNWGDSAFAAYLPKDGQYWLQLSSDRTLICHTKRRYKPWTEYELPIIPTCFNQAGDEFFIGSDDGLLYRFDESVVDDLVDVKVYPKFKTAFIELPFYDATLNMIQFIARSVSQTAFNLRIFINGNHSSPLHTYSHQLTLEDTLTIDSYGNTIIDDVEESLETPRATLPRKDLNVNCWSFQLEIRDMVTQSEPVYFKGIGIKYTNVED